MEAVCEHHGKLGIVHPLEIADRPVDGSAGEIAGGAAVEGTYEQVVRIRPVGARAGESKRAAAGRDTNRVEWATRREHLLHFSIGKRQHENSIGVGLNSWFV